MFYIINFLLLLAQWCSVLAVKTTDYQWDSLTEFPLSVDISSDTTHLRLDVNQLTYVPEGALCHVTGLLYLGLSHNRLTSVGNLSCVGNSLISLNIRVNPIKQLPASAFEGLNVLNSLNAELTQLTSFPEVWELGDTLTILNIGHNPSMGGMPAVATYSQLSVITHLYLTRIGLTGFPDLSMFADQLRLLHMGDEDDYKQVDLSEVSQFTTLIHLKLTKLGLTDVPHLPIPGLQLLDLAWNNLSLVPAERFSGYPNLRSLMLPYTSLPAVPDLSQLSAQLTELSLTGNKFQKIERRDLCQLPKLGRLFLGNTDLKTIPCACKLLSRVDINENELSTISAIGSCTRELNLNANNALKQIRGVHAATLRNIKQMWVSSTPLERIDDFLDLERNPTATIETRNNANLDVCKCEHVWLKVAQEMGANILLNTPSCNGVLWEDLTSTQLMQQCDDVTLTEPGASSTNGWSIHRPVAASCQLPTHVYLQDVLQVQCVQSCLGHGGCKAYKFRKTSGRRGNCQLLVPKAVVGIVDVPDEAEDGWKCYSAVAEVA